MSFTLPTGIVILANGENLLLPPAMTHADREYVAINKLRILRQLRSTQMNGAGFYAQAPATLLNELQAAPWAAIDIQTTSTTRSSRPLRVSKTTAIGDVEWQVYRAAHPEATLNSIPRARILSVYTESLGHSIWDLDALKREERRLLFEAAISGKILVGYNLGFALSWLFGETTARPSFVLDTMILFRQICPAILLRPFRWAGFVDEVKRRFAESLLKRYPHTSDDIEYFAACAEMLLPEKRFQSLASWCVSSLSTDHSAYAKAKLRLMLQVLGFLLPDISVEQMPDHIRNNQPWYVPFQTALVRLAEAHVRGVAFDPEAARDLMTDLLAEIESASSEVASYKEFAGLDDQLRDLHAGETDNMKRALAAHAAANGISLPAGGSGKFDRRSLQAIGSDRVPAWPPLDRLQSAKKAIATLEDYCDAARHDRRLHSLVAFTAVTGRTSSSEPSLQNVPRDRRFRRLFMARPGFMILAADYAAIELRIAVGLADRAIADLRTRISSDDAGWFLKHVRWGVRQAGRRPYPEDLPEGTQPTPQSQGAVIASVANTVLRRRTQAMASILQKGLDPHLVTAVDFARRSRVLDFEGHSLRWVSALDQLDIQALAGKLTQERQSGKAANFGLLCGMKEQGLHAYGIRNFGLEWTLEEASQARRAWFRLYPEFHLWHLWTKYCQSQKSDREKWRLWGFGGDKSKLVIPPYDVRVFKTTTLTGRPVAALNELNAALNYQAQGTGADILASAISELPEEIVAMMMMPVHDELVFEVPSGSVNAIRAIVEATMVAAAASVLGPSIPVAVKSSVGQTWSEK
jgi:DNA polymerase family A